MLYLVQLSDRSSPYYESDDFEIKLDEERGEEDGKAAGDVEDDRVTGEEEYEEVLIEDEETEVEGG